MLSRGEIIGGAGVLLGFAAAAVGYARGALAWLRGLVVVSVWVDCDLVEALAAYLHAEGRMWGGERVFGAAVKYLPSRGRSEVVGFQVFSVATSWLWFRGRPVWLTRAEKAIDRGEDVQFKLSGLRGSLDPEQLVRDACAWVSADMSAGHRRHHVTYHHGRVLGADDRGVPGAAPNTWYALGRDNPRRYFTHDLRDLEPEHAAESLDDMVMTPEVRDATQQVLRWFADREWCASHRVPWRMGLLYEGAPGSGKTSHVRCLAQHLDLPVHVFDLATMSNEDLRLAWAEMAAKAPCVALVEDVDRVFDGDRNVSPQGGLMSSGGLTFNALLNAIDGVERHDGVLLVITTNHLDKVDPAIRDRKGRVDRVVHFGPLDHAARLVLARRIIDDPAVAERVVADLAGASTSALVGACCDAARRARAGQVVELGPLRTATPPR